MNILFVSPCNTPFDPSQGGEQRSNMLLRACVKYGKVDVISFCNDTINDSYGANILFSKKMEDSALSFKTRKEKFMKLVGSLLPSHMTIIDREKERIIDDFIHKKSYDVIVIRYALSAINCGLYKYADKLMVDVDDNPAKSIAVRGLSSNTFLCKLFFWVYEKNVARSIKWFNRKVFRTTYSNIEDARLFNSFFLPNVPYYEVRKPLPETEIVKGRLLFVGDMTYPPNSEAMNHFVFKIFPTIQRYNQDVSMHIVGRCWDYDKKNWSGVKGVEVMGFVESLIKEYSQANVFVLPMLKGAGTCIKFLEAAQMGRPVVTSKSGFQGYRGIFKPGYDCFVATDDESFAKYVLMLLNDDALAAKMAKCADECMRSAYSKDRFDSVVGKVLGSFDVN